MAAAPAVPEPIDLLTHKGTRVPWRIEGIVGRGGQGVVYRATIGDTRYAVKSVQVPFRKGKLNRTAVNAESIIAQNIRKVKNANSTDSKHICKFYGIIERKEVMPGETPPTPPEFVYYDTRPLERNKLGQVIEIPKLYLIYEFIVGETLDKKEGFTPAQIENYGRQLLEACVAFHTSDIAHNDLKPENIIIDEHGILKIIDYGLSCKKATCHLAKRGMTPEYGAPEFVVTSKYNSGLIRYIFDNFQSDIFSIGCILYELITGHKLLRHLRYPFFDDTHLPAIELDGPYKRYETLLRQMTSFDSTSVTSAREMNEEMNKVMNELRNKSTKEEDKETKKKEFQTRFGIFARDFKPFGGNRPTAKEALRMWNELHPTEGSVPAAVGGRQTRRRRVSRRVSRRRRHNKN